MFSSKLDIRLVISVVITCVNLNKMNAHVQKLENKHWFVRKPICDIVFCVMLFLFRCFDFVLSYFEFLVYVFYVRCCLF